MIKIRIRDAAKKYDIKNAYQLQKFTGFSPGMSARLWKGKWHNANIKTLNTLCNLFKCTPNDLLEFTPDEED